MEATYSDTYQSEWKIMLRNLSKNEKKTKKNMMRGKMVYKKIIKMHL